MARTTNKAGRTPARHALRRAAGVEADLKAANLRHLNRIEGQVRGVRTMIEDDRYCADIIVQVAAVQESLRAVAKNLLKNHLRHCSRGAIAQGGHAADNAVAELIELVGKVAR